MNRVTLALTDELAGLLRREAQRQGVSVSSVARVAIERHLGVSPENRVKLSFAGIGRSGERHVARDAEQILAKEWGDAGGR